MKLQKQNKARVSIPKMKINSKAMSQAVGKLSPITQKKWDALSREKKIAIMGLI